VVARRPAPAAAPAPPPAVEAKAAAPPPAPAPAPEQKASDCNPPYYYEGAKKIFKPQCL
jgi:serine/threonine-protein kinase